MATSFIAAVFVYAAVGVLVAVPMALGVMGGLKRFGPAAADGTWGFRLLVVPGIVALWPLVLARWLRTPAP